MSTRYPVVEGVGWTLFAEMLDNDRLHIELKDTHAMFEIHKYEFNTYIDITIPDEMLSLFNDEVQKKIRKIRADSIL